MSSGSSSFGAWFEQVKAASGDAASAGAAGNDGEKTGRPGAGGGFFGGMRGLWRSEDGDGGQPAAADGTDEESGGLLGMSFSRGGSTAKAKGGMGDCASLTRTQRLQGFTVLVLGGGSLLAVALFVFLPFVSATSQQLCHGFACWACLLEPCRHRPGAASTQAHFMRECACSFPCGLRACVRACAPSPSAAD